VTDRERMVRIDELDAAHANLNAGLEEDGSIPDVDSAELETVPDTVED